MRKIVKIVWIIILLAMTTIVSGQEKSPNKESEPLTKLLLFKWKDNTSEEQKAEMVQLFEELVTEVEGFDHLEIEQLHYSSRFETSFVLKFGSEEAEERYRSHPKHQLIADLGPKMIQDFEEFKY